MRLDEIADVRTGYQFRGRVEHQPGAPYPVIQIKDLDREHRLDVSDLARVKLSRDAEPYRAHPNEVLFLSRGHRPFATMLEGPPENAIVSGYFFILHPKSAAVLPAYLAWYLNQPPFQSHLRPHLKGSNMPMVALGDFRALPVELPPLPVQQAIVELDTLRRREQALLTQVAQRRNELVHSACMKAVRHAIPPSRRT